jgi:hypothetical protein
MSLISQQDRELSIEALNCLSNQIDQKIFNNPNQRESLQQKKTEILTLLNWIKLEHYKNQ